MFKKAILFFVFFLLMSCNTSQSVVRTTPKYYPKPKKEVVHTTKKPLVKKPVTSNSNENKPIQNDQNRETETMESTSKTVVYTEVVSAYVLQFKDIAMSNMKNYGIPASIILAQGILESGAGKGDLALSGNNHFGIKCHVGWTGESVNHDDDAAQECFRKYKDPSESYKDHALFLTSRTRYSNLFLLPKGDYEAWAKGLKTYGYATDPKYPQKLISYIERYNLHQYDAQVLGTTYIPKTNQPIVVASSEIQDDGFYEVQKGDTFYSISKKFNLSVDELKQKNNLDDNALSIGKRLKIK
jgi:flagellum-specific peptidoglycan hydrolase FlgJ